MSDLYPKDVVQDFIDDYQDAWGVEVPVDDAFLILSLFDSLTILLEKYEGDCGGGYLPLRMMPSFKRR